MVDDHSQAAGSRLQRETAAPTAPLLGLWSFTPTREIKAVDRTVSKREGPEQWMDVALSLSLSDSVVGMLSTSSGALRDTAGKGIFMYIPVLTFSRVDHKAELSSCSDFIPHTVSTVPWLSMLVLNTYCPNSASAIVGHF